MSTNPWFSIAQRLSSFLSSVLSKYLIYEEKEDGALNVGIWGGTLDLQNVQLRSEAFHQILNKWKKPQVVDESGSSMEGAADNDPPIGSSEVGHKGTNNKSMSSLPNLSYFLSEEALLSQNSYSASSSLDVTLLEGTIGKLQAKLPWKNPCSYWKSLML